MGNSTYVPPPCNLKELSQSWATFPICISKYKHKRDHKSMTRQLFAQLMKALKITKTNPKTTALNSSHSSNHLGSNAMELIIQKFSISGKPAKRLQNYEIQDCIGKGKRGSAWLATSNHSESKHVQSMALKIVNYEDSTQFITKSFWYQLFQSRVKMFEPFLFQMLPRLQVLREATITKYAGKNKIGPKLVYASIFDPHQRSSQVSLLAMYALNITLSDYIKCQVQSWQEFNSEFFVNIATSLVQLFKRLKVLKWTHGDCHIENIMLQKGHIENIMLQDGLQTTFQLIDWSHASTLIYCPLLDIAKTIYHLHKMEHKYVKDMIQVVQPMLENFISCELSDQWEWLQRVNIKWDPSSKSCYKSMEKFYHEQVIQAEIAEWMSGSDQHQHQN